MALPPRPWTNRAGSAVAASRIGWSARSTTRRSSFAPWCLRITFWCADALRVYPAYGPTTAASSAERRYEVAVIAEVMAAASARPVSVS